jgi:hypothetical protein
MFVEFYTTNNIRVQVLEVSVLLNKKAFVQAYCFLPSGLTLYKLDMTEEDYSKWGNDDDYVKQWICSKVPLLGSVCETYDEFNQPVILTKESSNDIAVQTDNRSVHNDNDLERISSLEAQIAEQTKLVAQMKSILISKGMI